MSDTRKIIDFAAEDNAVAFRDALYSAIHDRVTAHIEAKKQEVAQNLITRNEEKENQVETQEEEFATEEELTEGHHMHTHTVHMADPVSGEWKGKMLMNADNDNHAVRQAKNMAGKHGLKVMKVSKNHVIHSDRTMHEETIWEDEMLDERKIMGYATGAARRKKMANAEPAKKQSMMDKIKSKLHLNGEEVEYDEEQLNEYSVRNNDYKSSHVYINKPGKDEPFKKPDTGITKPEKPIKEPEYKSSHVHINTKPVNQNRMKDIKKMKEDYELDEGKMDDLEDARREKAEKKASEYKFGPKPKKTLATIRKVAGHSDSGAKRDDKEKDED